MKTLAKIPYFGEYLHYGLFEPFWFIHLWVVEKLLKDGVYYFLADLSADVFEFIPYLVGILEVYDIENNLIANTFLDDFLHYTYCHTVFLDLFCP